MRGLRSYRKRYCPFSTLAHSARQPDQVRTTQYFPEEYALSSKLVAERQMTMASDVDSPVATVAGSGPPGTAMTAGAIGIGAGAAAAAAASSTSDSGKALPSVPHAKGAAEEGGSNKLNSRKVIYILIGLLILVIVLAAVIGGAVGSKAVSDARQ